MNNNRKDEHAFIQIIDAQIFVLIRKKKFNKEFSEQKKKRIEEYKMNMCV